MSFVTFYEDEKVNIAVMDTQHEEMANIINEVHSAFTLNDNVALLQGLNNLTELLQIHFEYEERMMKETKFLGYISHKLEHDRIHKKILTIAKSYSENKPILTPEEMNNVRNWFHNHIELSDKKCGAHFVSQGIK